MEAAAAGVYRSAGWHKDYPRLQILTVEEMIAGDEVEMPAMRQTNVAYPKKAPPAKGVKAKQGKFPFGGLRLSRMLLRPPRSSE